LGVDKTTKEGKLYTAAIDLLDDVVLAISEMSEGLEHMGEDIEAIEEDLDEVLEDLYGDEDDDCCGEYDFEGELYEVTCPACEDQICVDEDMLDQGEIACPGCGKNLEFDLDGELDKEELGDKP